VTEDELVRLELDLVVNDEEAYTRIVRRLQQALLKMADLPMSRKHRELWREAYGIIGDDTMLGVPDEKELEALDEPTGDIE
jgi:hypothetical protein